MKAKYWQRGEALDYKNNTDAKIEAGTVVVLGARIGVAGTEILPGEIGSVHVEGVFELEKVAEEEISLGTAVFFSETGVTVAGEEESVAVGYAAADAAASSKTVMVKINA